MEIWIAHSAPRLDLLRRLRNHEARGRKEWAVQGLRDGSHEEETMNNDIKALLVDAMEAALWELIKLKDIKEQMEKGTASDFLHSHYAQHKDAAWQQARLAARNYSAAISALERDTETAAPYGGQPSVKTDSQESPAVEHRVSAATCEMPPEPSFVTKLRKISPTKSGGDLVIKHIDVLRAVCVARGERIENLTKLLNEAYGMLLGRGYLRRRIVQTLADPERKAES